VYGHAVHGEGGAKRRSRRSTVLVTNNGPEACTMFGYIGMQLLGPGNSRIPTNVVRDPSDPKTLVTLPPGGGQAFTTIQWGVVPSGNEPQNGPCQPNPSNVPVYSPNGTGPLVQPWPNGPVCQQGQITTAR
jgi:hypothetical protein